MSKTSGVSSSGSDSSILSPYESPVAQVKQHGAGNLTGDLRKVKDLAADFHNLILKWNALNAQGMDVITQIANIKIEKVLAPQETDEEEKLRPLPLELSPLCDRLLGIVDAMEKVESKMGQKALQAESLWNLSNFQKGKQREPLLFSTMTWEAVAQTTREIHDSYRKEVALKKELCRQVAHAQSRDVLLLYSSTWLHQPYLGPSLQDQLDALLLETGHSKG